MNFGPWSGRRDSLEGVYLDLAPVALDAGADGVTAARSLLELAAAQNVPADDLRGSLGLDPIAARARTGTPVDLQELVKTDYWSPPQEAAGTIEE